MTARIDQAAVEHVPVGVQLHRILSRIPPAQGRFALARVLRGWERIIGDLPLLCGLLHRFVLRLRVWLHVLRWRQWVIRRGRQRLVRG
ncbi:hypothetical protein KIK06_15010 [Nocardiopsis sp. EMB25]|nr:hypothetical protein [Nocardiopsis sp. EMB25]